MNVIQLPQTHPLVVIQAGNSIPAKPRNVLLKTGLSVIFSRRIIYQKREQSRPIEFQSPCRHPFSIFDLWRHFPTRHPSKSLAIPLQILGHLAIWNLRVGLAWFSSNWRQCAKSGIPCRMWRVAWLGNFLNQHVFIEGRVEMWNLLISFRNWSDFELGETKI